VNLHVSRLFRVRTADRRETGFPKERAKHPKFRPPSRVPFCRRINRSTRKTVLNHGGQENTEEKQKIKRPLFVPMPPALFSSSLGAFRVLRVSNRRIRVQCSSRSRGRWHVMPPPSPLRAGGREPLEIHFPAWLPSWLAISQKPPDSPSWKQGAAALRRGIPVAAASRVAEFPLCFIAMRDFFWEKKPHLQTYEKRAKQVFSMFP